MMPCPGARGPGGEQAEGGRTSGISAEELATRGGDGDGYTWKQDPGEIEISIPVPSGTKGKDIKAKFGAASFTAASAWIPTAAPVFRCHEPLLALALAAPAADWNLLLLVARSMALLVALVVALLVTLVVALLVALVVALLVALSPLRAKRACFVLAGPFACGAALLEPPWAGTG